MSARPEAVLFDFDGTLVHIAIDFEAMRNNAAAVVRSYGEQPDAGLFTLEMVESVRDRLAQRDPVSAQAFQEEAMASIQEVELAATGKAQPLPGVVRTLDWLRDQGIAIGIVTRNCRSAVRAVTQTYSLAFDALLTRDDVRHVKPHPEHLLAALRCLGTTPGKSIMVGDHPTDIAAAHAAGMTAIAVTTTRPADAFDSRPEFIVNDMAELIDIIETGAWLREHQ